MRLYPAYLAAGLALSGISHAAEGSARSAPGTDAPISPVRQFLRDSIKVPPPPPAKPVEPVAKPEAKPETKASDAPIVLPIFRVKERPTDQIFDQVNASVAQVDRLRSHPLFQTNRLEILLPPKVEPGPADMKRLRLDILKLKW